MAVAAKDIAQILSAEAQNRLDEIASGLDQQQLLWASGYLAGRAALGGELNLATSAAVAPALAAAPAARVAVLYASETGNSRRIAEEFAAHLQASGLPVHLSDLSEYKPRQLAKEKQAVIVAATHGLGDAPEGTEAFFEYWFSDKAPQLADLSYSVLALGDSSYDDFCQIGVEIDERFAALGATRVHPRVDCDVDFEVDAQGWRDGVFEKLERTEPAASRAPVPYIHAVSDTGFSRARPFDAELLVDQRITGRDSSKDVRHIELLLEDSGLDYLPGDSFGVWPTNPTVLVDQLISATGLDEQATVNVGDAAISLRDALSSKREITATSRGFLQAYAKAIGNSELQQRADGKGLKPWLYQHQVIDVVTNYPGDLDAQVFVDCLRGLTPRLYSIASSPDASSGEVHLTVGVVDYQAFGRPHGGAASGYLASSPELVSGFVEKNDRFRLPANNDVPIVMIGAGTGIAPYRAFLQHRQHHGAKGNNWLVFGDRTMRSDFLYQQELLRWRRDGLLTELDVAFSRDQAEKHYVQHRLVERGDDIYKWMEAGAHFYVCGDADRMAPDVHAALLQVIAQHGNRDADAATAYLEQMRKAGRYQRDVY